MTFLTHVTNLKIGNSLFKGSADDLNTVANTKKGEAMPCKAVVLNDSNNFSGINELKTDKIITNDLIVTGIHQELSASGIVVRSFTGDNLDGRMIKKDVIGDLTLTNYNPNGREDFFSIEIIGYIYPRYTEEYTFKLSGDDKIRLWVNNELLFNKWDSGFIEDQPSKKINLIANKYYPLYIHHADVEGDESLQVKWQSISQELEIIPSNRLAWDDRLPDIRKKLYIEDSFHLYSSKTEFGNISSNLNIDEYGKLNLNCYGNYISLNKDVDIIDHNGIDVGLLLNNERVKSTAEELNYNANLIRGIASSDKSLVLDINKNIKEINHLSANILTGTIQTPLQPNITSIGTLNSLIIANDTGNNIKLQHGIDNNTFLDIITSSTGEINFNTYGTNPSFKFNHPFSGTLLTSNQPYITNIGILESLTVQNGIDGTLLTPHQTNITKLGKIEELNVDDGDTDNEDDENKKKVKIKHNTGKCMRLKRSRDIFTDFDISENGNLEIDVKGIDPIVKFKNCKLELKLDEGDQENITKVGTLSDLNVTGSVQFFDNTPSTTNSNGAFLLNGGLSISNTTDAVDVTNGGSLTSAGGGAFAKTVYIGSDLHVSGNLNINGTTNTINSEIIEIEDNIILLNAGPTGIGADTGFLSERFQQENKTGAGDVVTDSPKESYTILSATADSIKLPFLANNTSNYYSNWWIKITSGVATNHIYKVSSYIGLTRTLNFNSTINFIPSAGDTINLYNRVYSACIWDEFNKSFKIGFTATDSSAQNVNINDYADAAIGKVISSSNDFSTSPTTGGGLFKGGVGIDCVADVVDHTNGGSLTTAGGVAIGKSLIVKDKIKASEIEGTLLTPSQPNITSIGTLTDLTVSGALNVSSLVIDVVNTTILTPLQPHIKTIGNLTKLNVNSSPLTMSSSTYRTNFTDPSGKVLQLSSIDTNNVNFDITDNGDLKISEKIITEKGIDATILKSIQPNITSIGVLDKLKVEDNSNNYATTIINNTGKNLRLQYNSNKYTDFRTTPAGDLIIDPNGTKTHFHSHIDMGDCNIYDVGYINANTVSGTLTTANQPNIKTLGCLTNVTITDNLKIGDTTSTSVPLTVGKEKYTYVGGLGYLDNKGIEGYKYSCYNKYYSMIASGRILCKDEITVYSDKNRKTDIEELDKEQCKKFLNVKPVSFKYKNIEDDSRRYGFIAQDIQREGFHEPISSFKDDEGESLTLCYDQLIPIMAKNIQTLYEEINNLKNEIKELKKL